MSSIDERRLRLKAQLMNDFHAYSRACLKIRTKAGTVQPFFANRSQRFLHERLEKQRAERGRVRALVLKGRQVGISTYIAARFYWRISHKRGVRAFILTHLDTASDNLFGIAKRYHDNCPELVKPQTGRSNAKELVFSVLDSGYKVATAGSAEVGRSETIQFFHGSEVAFWPNAQNHSAGIRQAIAQVDGTEDIRESTANGIGNSFHAEWKAAERGDSEYEPIFIPWFWHEEYETERNKDWSPSETWVEYQNLYGLTDAQLYWGWLKNRELAVIAGGTPDEPCWQFKQEYPANADEAFQTSGEEAFIKPEVVLRARKAKASPYGPIILGVDPARGGGDKTGIIDRQGRLMGANVAKIIDMDDLMAIAGEVQKIVKDINPAKVVVDVTGLGAGLYDRLRETIGDKVEGVNFGAKAYDHEAYSNRRTEMWDELRKWFNDPAGVQVPDRDDLQGDICAPVRGKGATHFKSNGQLQLESKDHIKERLTHSPDLGDAAALTFGIEIDPTVDQVDDPYSVGMGSNGGWLSG